MNPLSDFEKALAAENFEMVETMVGKQVKSFQSKYRWIHPDEALSAAGNAYLTAVGTYNDSKGTFENWIAYKVNKALKTLLRITARRYKKTKNVAEQEELEAFPDPEKEERFWLDVWLATLPADARTVAMMVFETPFAIHVRIAELGGFETPEAFRNGVREYLRDSGWDEDRIQRAFNRIQNSL